MRRRLCAAVAWIVGEGPAKDSSITARALLAVILAKSSATTRVAITCVPELGDWLGLAPRTIDHALRELRQAGAVETRERYEGGLVVGVDCRIVVPDARPGHPLAVLDKKDLAVLLTVCEALFGPGWKHADRPDTPAGLLAARRGRGAANPRLALLRVYLKSRSDGTLPLAGGRVPKGYGRTDMTIGRLLGGGPSVGKRALADMVLAGAAVKETGPATTGMEGRARVRFPAAVGTARLKAVKTPKPGVPAQSFTAVRWQASAAEAKTQLNGAQDAAGPGIPAQSFTAPLHAVHTPVLPAGGDVEVGCGSPAGGGTGLSHDGGDARTREEGPAADGQAVPARPAGGGRGGALRAENGSISLPPTHPLHRVPDVVLDAIPGVFEAMASDGQRGQAAADILASLETGTWAPARLAARLSARFAPMTLTDPGAGRGYIADAFRWLRSQLPARAATRHEHERAEAARLERLEDGLDPAAVAAALSARLKAEEPEAKAQAGAREEAARRIADHEAAHDAAEEHFRNLLLAQGKTGVSLAAWLDRAMQTWHAENPAPEPHPAA
ncbi:helix-turn-helix transcriptional regulator [Streptomyces roseifaciens]